MTTDQDLIKLIEQLREPVARSLQYEHAAHLRPRDVPNTWDIAKPLIDAMAEHPDFAKPSSKFFLGKQINFANEYQSLNVLRISLDSGAAEAIAWYRRVAATEQTKMRVVAEVYGLWVQEPHTFSNGVTLLPVAVLPDSPNSRMLKQFDLRFGIEFPAAVMLEIEDVHDESAEAGHERFLKISETMRKTVTAFALSDDAAPTMAISWQEFADQELQATEVGRTWMSSRHEGRIPSYAANVTDDMLDWVEKYLKLTPSVANACNVPLARLNLARRRVTPGDKAIDGSVCLEALLSGGDRGELTHRLAVRAALLLGRSLEERQKVAEKVRKFYRLRSDIVHGSASKKEADSHGVAKEGLSICLSALREIVTSGRLPEPKLWELTGGPAWNRYAEADRPSV